MCVCVFVRYTHLDLISIFNPRATRTAALYRPNYCLAWSGLTRLIQFIHAAKRADFQLFTTQPTHTHIHTHSYIELVYTNTHSQPRFIHAFKQKVNISYLHIFTVLNRAAHQRIYSQTYLQSNTQILTHTHINTHRYTPISAVNCGSCHHHLSNFSTMPTGINATSKYYSNTIRTDC